MIRLATERLALAPVAVQDWDDLLSLWTDAGFTRHVMGRALTREEVWFRLLRDLGHWQATGRGAWTIRETATGAYVGSVGVLDYRRDLDVAFDAPELGWGIAPAFQRRGMAAEALAAALAWADEALGADRTVCMITPENAPSLRLAANAGYRPFAETTYKGAAVILHERARGAGAAYARR